MSFFFSPSLVWSEIFQAIHLWHNRILQVQEYYYVSCHNLINSFPFSVTFWELYSHSVESQYTCYQRDSLKLHGVECCMTEHTCPELTSFRYYFIFLKYYIYFRYPPFKNLLSNPNTLQHSTYEQMMKNLCIKQIISLYMSLSSANKPIISVNFNREILTIGMNTFAHSFEGSFSNETLPESIKICFDNVDVVSTLLKTEGGYVVDCENGRVGLKIFYQLAGERKEKIIYINLHPVEKIDQIKLRAQRLAKNMKSLNNEQRPRCNSEFKTKANGNFPFFDMSASRRHIQSYFGSNKSQFFTKTIANFQVRNKSIMYTGPQKWQQIILPITLNPDLFTLKIKILETRHRWLGIGVVDLEKQSKSDSSLLVGNCICYVGAGILHQPGQEGGYQCSCEGVGFLEEEVVYMNVDLRDGWIEWKVRGQIRAQLHVPFLSTNRKLAPYFQFYNRGDRIEWESIC